MKWCTDCEKEVYGDWCQVCFPSPVLDSRGNRIDF